MPPVTQQPILNSFPTEEIRFAIPGPAGNLEAQSSVPTIAPQPIIGIICHPHPLFGGTMDNKVVTTIARAFKDLGIPNIRFNFRGVGNSAGTFDQGIGESDDLLAIYHWVKQTNPSATIWLAGFSFGAYISLRVAYQLPIKLLLSIAPAVNHFDTKLIQHPNCPWLVIQGDQDEVVPAQEVYAWAESLVPAPTLLKFPETSHFFHGQLINLRLQIEQSLQPYLSN